MIIQETHDEFKRRMMFIVGDYGRLCKINYNIEFEINGKMRQFYSISVAKNRDTALKYAGLAPTDLIKIRINTTS
jgi:hypothetical protein